MLNTIAVTTASVGGVELVDQIPDTGNPKIEIIKLIIQAVVGLVGLIKLLKSKKQIKDVQ